MKKIKEEKNIEVLVNIRYKNIDDQLVQTYDFTSSNKKILNYLFDTRFLFKRKIDRLIKEFLLEGYISRVDEKSRIVITYKNQEKPKNCIRKLQAYVPPYFGCMYCELAEIKGDFIYCPEKNKHYTVASQGVVRCQIFRSKEKILT